MRFINGHNRVGLRPYRFSASESSKGGHNKKGYKYSVEHKERIRKGKLARGFKGPTHGKHRSKEMKARQRKVAIEKNMGQYFPRKSGADHHRWKGGCEAYQKQKALKRDNYTCRRCGLRDEEIVVVDHIKPKAIYPELSGVLENLQALCPNCHARKTNAEKKEIFRIKRMRS